MSKADPLLFLNKNILCIVIFPLNAVRVLHHIRLLRTQVVPK